MNVEYINPFVVSVTEFFNTMLGVNVERTSIGIAAELSATDGFRAIIGLSGAICGTVVLVLPMNTGNQLVKRLLCSEEVPDEDTLRDGVSEAVNIIAGNAKARLPQKDGRSISLSLPTVISGNGVKIECPSDTAVVDIGFKSDLGDFSLKIGFQNTIN